MDFSLLLNQAHVLTLWPNNALLAGCVLLLLWLYMRCALPSSVDCPVDGCALETGQEIQGTSCEEGAYFSLELLAVFQIISSILEHDFVQGKVAGDVIAPLVERVLPEMESVGVQGVSITVNQERFQAGICSGDGWHLERDIDGDNVEKGVLQFYGVLLDQDYPVSQQRVCMKIADYLAGRLSRFLLLRKSMQEVALFRHLIDQAAEIILIIDPLSGKILDVNARACIELGYAPHELAGKRLGMILDVDQNDFFVENESEKYGHEMFMETKLIRHDHTTFPVEMSLKNIDLAERKYQLAMARDLSARNEMIDQKMDMERQLIQSEKMASVGQLSAGIAHEINNPISFITSNLGVMEEYVQDVSRLLTGYRDFVRMVEIEDDVLCEKHLALTLLEDEIEGGDLLKDLKDVVSESLEGADRIKNIVQDMKSFAHPGEDKLKATDLNKGLNSTLNIAWNELKYKAEVVKDYGKISQVMCFPQQINQVFMNIIVNAGQAIEKEGVITISTFQRKNMVHISIADNGQGMKTEVTDHIFEPFYTTKEVGKGTGLGLNVAYNIIRKHGGHIHVESKVGKGTIFMISLPVQGPKGKEDGV